MGDNWIAHKIGDLGRVVTGKTPSTTESENFVGAFPFITIPDLGDRVYIDTSERTLSDVGASKMKSLLLPPNSVMMSCIATIGKCGITTKPSFTNQQINSVICKPEIVDPLFLYYIFTQLGLELEAAGGGGSVYTNVSKSRFSEISVSLPPLPEQRAIAGVLGALDDKIDLNQRMTRTLTAMVWAIFKSWFVDFDPVFAKAIGLHPRGMDIDTAQLFPSAFHGDIPDGWTFAQFRDFLIPINARIGREKAPEFSATIKGLSLRDENFKKSLSKSNEKNKRIVKGNLVFGLSRQTLNFGVMTDDIGSVSPVYEIFDVDNTVYIPELLEMYIRLKMDEYIDILKPAAREGQAIDKSYLLTKKILVPSMTIQQRYQQVCSAFCDKIAQNEKESRTLASLRDALLPKLMRGEVRVSEL